MFLGIRKGDESSKAMTKHERSARRKSFFRDPDQIAEIGEVVVEVVDMSPLPGRFAVSTIVASPNYKSHSHHVVGHMRVSVAVLSLSVSEDESSSWLSGRYPGLIINLDRAFAFEMAFLMTPSLPRQG